MCLGSSKFNQGIKGEKEWEEGIPHIAAISG
jgi:hypothetical protein